MICLWIGLRQELNHMPHSNPNFYDAIVSGISSSQNHWGTGSLTSSYVAHIAGIIYNAINTISTNLDAEGELLQSIVGGLFSTNPIIPSLDSNYTTVAAAISVLFEQQRVGLDPTSSGGAGPQGNQGWQGTGGGGGGGTQGPQGRQGVQGSTGSGTQGPQGSTGSGTQGRQGAQGSTGSGFQGNQGAKGDQGDIGTQGAQGSTGSGFQGNQGFQGDLGTQGVQGTIGSGTQGAQGAQGDVGSGTQGFQGFQGPSGSGGTIFVGLASALPDPAGFIDGTMYIPTDDTTQLIDISHHWNILIPGSAPVPMSVGDISGWTYESGITGAAVLQAHNSYTRMVSLLANPAPDYVDWLPPSPALNVGPGGIWTITMATKYIPSNTRYLDGNPYSSINIVLLDGSGNRFMFGPQDSPSGPLLLSAAACGFSGHTRNYYGGLSANNLHTTNYITWVRLRFDGVNYISEYSVDGANWNVSTAGGTNIFNWGGGAIVPVSWGVGTQYIPNSFGNWDIYQLDQTPTNG
jgi:hypothetical protein